MAISHGCSVDQGSRLIMRNGSRMNGIKQLIEKLLFIIIIVIFFYCPVIFTSRRVYIIHHFRIEHALSRAFNCTRSNYGRCRSAALLQRVVQSIARRRAEATVTAVGVVLGRP